ncbi:SDR family NAD(P)-dependent oxidoreductase [Alkalihalobacillus pseudalcaliphilus]|uniref:SDR family NAD(P)-dependent oxidoreductase n=1 Tax=Alkalihalobacillus pseudalcaliphilus TaxID=79884 RepID=UPI00064DE32C|nr:SDR family NAD(P)-dependent oxidoreductase [Alkalihalobacillus pseudalcaliphilus]KMK78052.1 short-chain dehydrogenase [Alkalihalobacillus pseudalcaliphilus]
MKTAFITGANSGFGYLISLELLKSGYQVIATMRNLENRLELVEAVHHLQLQKHLHVHKMDVTKEEEVKTVTEEIDSSFGKVDVLINNAGFCQGGFFQDLTLKEWREQYDVNVTGAFVVTKELLPLLRKSDSGKIINISSVSGFFAFPGMSAYCSSKFALEGMSESLRLELLKEGIYVSLIEPGSFKTPLWEKSLRAYDEGNQDLSLFKRNVLRKAKSAAANADDPQIVTNLVKKVCAKRKPKLRYQVGNGIQAMYYLKRMMPSSLLEKVIFKQVNR